MDGYPLTDVTAAPTAAEILCLESTDSSAACANCAGKLPRAPKSSQFILMRRRNMPTDTQATCRFSVNCTCRCNQQPTSSHVGIRGPNDPISSWIHYGLGGAHKQVPLL